MELFNHITSHEIVGAILGIVLVWILKYSKEKDQFDEKNESFSLKGWFKKWFVKKNDNIVAHVFFCFAALYIGVDNLQAWLGENMTLPDNVDEIGASFIIGFTGVYLVEIVKKAL